MLSAAALGGCVMQDAAGYQASHLSLFIADLFLQLSLRMPFSQSTGCQGRAQRSVVECGASLEENLRLLRDQSRRDSANKS